MKYQIGKVKTTLSLTHTLTLSNCSKLNLDCKWQFLFFITNKPIQNVLAENCRMKKNGGGTK